MHPQQGTIAIQTRARTQTAVIASWVNGHAGLMLAAALLAAVTRTPALVAAAAGMSFAVFAVAAGRSLAGLRPCGGYANLLTALRLGLILFAAAVMERVPAAWMLALLAANVALDLGDGFIARRAGQVTQFGAVFDRETDGVFVLVAYLYFFVVANVPAWILLPGVLPYAYRVVICAARVHSDGQEREPSAVVLAGLNFALLLAALAAPDGLRLALLAVSTALVSISFMLSFRTLHLGDDSSLPE